MRNFFENVTGIFVDVPNATITAISRFIAGGGDVFDRAGFLGSLNKSKNNSLLDSYLLPNPSGLLPIEFFKEPALLPFFCTNERSTTRAFRSSGTTSKTQSESPFSQAGLALYRAAALQSFAAALDAADRTGTLKKCQGVSLIPSADVWTASSLAQMMSWIAEEYKVAFVADDHAGQEADALKALIADAKEPLWIFGTAFHFINLFDDGLRTKLPAGSFVIETGGTKGRSRSVSRRELFETISTMFALPQKQILSEYSMSELAAQSWDFGADQEESRRYRFPAWVDVSVLLQDGTVAREGTGALIVNDPLRIDLSHPIRTEDIVKLSGNEFHILRRSNAAPLKGCSLFAERHEQPTRPQRQTQKERPHFTETHDPIMRAREALRIARDLLSRTSVAAAFAEECDSSLLGNLAVEDLARSLPTCAEDLVHATHDSAIEPGSAWTILAPANHSLAAVHPLLCAYVAGAHIAAKIPSKFLTEGSFLNLLITGLNQAAPGFLSLLPHEYRIEQEADLPADHKILVFGSDETVRHLANIAPGRVSGFGDVIAVASGDLDAVRSHAREIARDFFSLRQSGCMSGRAFFLEQKSPNDLQEALGLLKDAADTYASTISVDDAAAIHGERQRYETLFAARHLRSAKGKSGPLVIGMTWDDDSVPEAAAAQKAFTLPVIALPGQGANFVNNLKSLVLKQLNVGLMLYPAESALGNSLAESTKNIGRFLSFRSFGKAQSPAFNGLHEGRPLFQISC